MTYVILIIAALLLFVIFKFVKGFQNNRVIADDNHFKQADVEVTFATGAINIKGNTYDVNQVTGLLTEANSSTQKHGNSMAWNAIIEVDDFKKPRHKINFLSRNKANQFTQRLSTALRKAGGPSFS